MLSTKRIRVLLIFFEQRINLYFGLCEEDWVITAW